MSQSAREGLEVGTLYDVLFLVYV